jgi:K+-sensing histidine kinase KdpD/DNA-binding response OmpR family regulator
MWKKLLGALKIQEGDLPWIEPVLKALIRGGMITVAVLIALSFFLILYGQLGFWRLLVSSSVLLAAMFFLDRLSRRGHLDLALNLLLGAIVIYATVIGLLGFLRGEASLLLYALPIVIAASLLTPEASLHWGGISIVIAVIRMLIAAFALREPVDYAAFAIGIVCLGTIAMLTWLFSRSHLQVRMGLRRQVSQGRAGIEIGHAITAALDPSSIVRQAVQLIHDAFGYYLVGLFVVDPRSDVAVLADAAGEGAATLKERGFQVALSGTTVVAAAINQKRQRTVVSWETSVDARERTIQFTYDRLPTRAELVVPLQVGERVLGALDIHSTELDPFSESDIHTLAGLVGHVANALEGARLLDDVQRRHQELTALYDQTERRARYLETTAQLARAISSVHDPQELLGQAVNLVSDGLNLYHAGIFLLDDADEWAVLAAANSEGGQRMIARGHRLSVGKQGIVGWVTATGQPRIALDVGEDAVYFDNPDLPDTRSEIALPLKIGDRVIGALDVQSVREAAFGEEDAAVLQTTADQIAIAIENARLFQLTQRALQEMQMLQRHYVSQKWERVSARQEGLGAEYRGMGIPSLETIWTPEMEMAWEREAPVTLSDVNALLPEEGDGRDKDTSALSSLSAHAALAVPIKLRGETIGVLGLQETDETRSWSSDEVAMVTSVVDQLALALENARLFEETQRRATQLAAAAEIARGATAILEVDRLLEETVQLISAQFGFYHAGVFLLDEPNEYAVLQAASSAGGQRMLGRGHKLRIGEAGIVGHVAATGEPRIATDVGGDAVFFNSPDLPDTRSEMALPLKVRDRVIGVLDVQSAQSAAFAEEDVTALQTMADQLAVAIANGQLFQRVRADAMRRALINRVTQAATSSLEIKELQSRAGEAISEQLEMPSAIFGWNAGSETLQTVTLHDLAGNNITPSEPLVITAEMAPAMFQAVQTRQLQVLFDVPAQTSGVAAELARQLGIVDAAYIPLISRDQILGLLALGRPQAHPVLDEGELSFLEVVAANLGVALENARLFQDAVETAERLAEVDRLKSQFLANMSHELRTPLNSIIGFSRVILKGIDGSLTDMQRTDLQTVYDSGQHLLNLINDILEISKIEAGKMEIAFEEVDLQEIIKSVMSTAIGLVKDKPIELQQSVPPDLPNIHGDGRRIRQVLVNLIGNAAKFTEQGFIRLEAVATPDEVTISVADSGIGIPSEKQAVIFQPFTQVDASSTRRAGGTGLGLSICKSFVEMHGGRIWLDSTAGAGSTFYVSLPIQGPPSPVGEQQATGEEPQPVETPEATMEKGGRVVLCVEDDEGVITLFRRYLNRQGYQVIGLADSKRALEEAKRLRPYAITLDVMMPDKDGWQVIQELKADPETNHIPVIICSIIAEKGRGISLGAADYLVKPILEQDLLAALDQLDREEGRHRVLVVDDHAEDRQLLRRMIESQEGYEVVEAAGGQEAINLVKQVFPHIIILDLMMPEMDGFAVLEAIKRDETTRSIPIIVVTAKDLTDEERQALNHNVTALIQKGLLNKNELLEDVAAALRKLDHHQPQAAAQPAS